MLIVNTSDRFHTGTFSVQAPFIADGSEAHIPPKGFHFEPGEVVELPDDAGTHFLKLYGDYGLMRYKTGDDIEELKARGRRTWYRTLERQCAEVEHQNGARLAQGLPPLVPGEHIVELQRTRNRLAEELSQVPTPAAKAPKGTETPEFKRAAAAQRERAADAPSAT